MSQSAFPIPNELVHEICERLHSRHDYASLCAASRSMQVQWQRVLTRTQRENMFTRFFTDEDWSFEKAIEWMEHNAMERPTTTVILYETLMPQLFYSTTTTKMSFLWRQLAQRYYGQGQQTDAEMLLEVVWQAIWKRRTKIDTVRHAMQLVEIYTIKEQYEHGLRILKAILEYQIQEGIPGGEVAYLLAQEHRRHHQHDDALKILEDYWRNEDLRNKDSFYDDMIGDLLVILYERTGQWENATKVLEARWQDQGYLDPQKEGAQLANLYAKCGRKKEEIRIREELAEYSD